MVLTYSKSAIKGGSGQFLGNLIPGKPNMVNWTFDESCYSYN